MKDLTMRPHLAPRRQQAGGISVGTLLLLSVVILLMALGAVGYLLYQTRSEKQDVQRAKLAAEKKLAEAEQKLLEEKAAATTAQAQKDKQDRDNRLAIAQSLRDSFASRAGVVTNSLQAVLDRIPETERELNQFRRGATGVPVTCFPDLVEAASTFFSGKLTMPSRNVGIAHLEGIRRMLIRNAENRGTETQPSDEAEKLISETRSWADGADAELTKISAFMKSLLEDAAAKVREPNAQTANSLDEAIDRLRTFNVRAIAQAQADATKKAEAITQTALNNTIVEDGKRKAAEIAEENDRKERVRLAALEKQKLIEEARSVGIRNLLAPLLTPGRIDCDKTLMEERGPVSWGKLSKAISGERGLLNLQQITSTTYDKDRKRLPRVDLKKDAATYERLVEMRRALMRLGPTLVELQMLRP